MSNLPLDPKERLKRKREGIAIGVLALAFIGLSLFEFKLTKLSSTLPFVNSIFFFGLLNLNIVLLVGLFWLIFKNIGKLILERRRRILGSRLKTKLVVAFLAFSITPTVIIFIISSLYINSSFDKWFSIKIQNTLQNSLEITKAFYKNADQNAMHFAEHISKGMNTSLLSKRSDIRKHLKDQLGFLALHAVEYYSDPFEERVLVQNESNPELPEFYPRLSLDLLEKSLGGEKVSVIQQMGSGDLIRCVVPIRFGNDVVGAIAVSSYIPISLVNKVDEISSVFDDYKGTNPLKYPIKTTYFVILIMITLVILFVAIWMGLYLARELTVPVESLVLGAKEVGAGNLDVEIEGSGDDEIAVLVNSFNKMTRHLKQNQAELTKASIDLERRKVQLEAVLANIGTGVIVVDVNGVITTLNRAASQLLEIDSHYAIGKHFNETLAEKAPALKDLIERSRSQTRGQENLNAIVTQWNHDTNFGNRSLAGIATSLQDETHHPWGVVLVVDDMTHLVKAQREVAWREVARRIAHEIKNPLTPIKLSAQRLQRRLSGLRGKDGEIVRDCTQTIVRHTDELKDLVNEFSNFARFPEINPTLNFINEVLKEVVALFSQAHPEIDFYVNLEPKIPEFRFDRDQLKRVLINLIDNAISALTEYPPASRKEIKIESHFNNQLNMTAITIADNGPGMSETTKSRIFEPYYSTKKNGTGLGLAIAKRIVNDHDGFIRCSTVLGKGTQFLIELPTTIHFKEFHNEENARALNLDH